MNSYQINLEAARQQGFGDGTDPESARRGITDAARLKMFGTTYMQGYRIGRREAMSRRQGPCNIGSGAGDDCPPTVGETDEYYQFSMIDGLALRLQNDIVHAMTVVCREDARAKAVERAARLYGFDRVFDVNLHPRARAHIDDFVMKNLNKYQKRSLVSIEGANVKPPSSGRPEDKIEETQEAVANEEMLTGFFSTVLSNRVSSVKVWSSYA